MNRNFYKKMKNYKEIKGFIQNEYIRIADMNELTEIRPLFFLFAENMCLRAVRGEDISLMGWTFKGR